MLSANRKLSLELIDFIQKYQTVNIIDTSLSTTNSKNDNTNGNSNNINSLSFTSQQFNDLNGYMIQFLNSNLNKSNKVTNQSIVLYPTNCILFDNGHLIVLNDL